MRRITGGRFVLGEWSEWARRDDLENNEDRLRSRTRICSSKTTRHFVKGRASSAEKFHK